MEWVVGCRVDSSPCLFIYRSPFIIRHSLLLDVLLQSFFYHTFTCDLFSRDLMIRNFFQLFKTLYYFGLKKITELSRMWK